MKKLPGGDAEKRTIHIALGVGVPVIYLTHIYAERYTRGIIVSMTATHATVRRDDGRREMVELIYLGADKDRAMNRRRRRT